MALSNWDTLAFGEDGGVSVGEFQLGGGAVLEIYKNWIYVRHSSAWFDGNGFSGDIVLYIDNGKLKYAGCDISAERSTLQSACFVFVSDRDYTNGTNRFFAGIGCSAYLGTLEYIRRNDPEKLKELPEWCRELEPLFSEWNSSTGTGLVFLRDGEYVTVPVYGLDEEPETFVGVLPELYDEFIVWLGEKVKDIGNVSAELWFDKVKLAKPVRYNQGDAYFAGHMKHEIPGTPIGEQDATIMQHVVDCMKDEEGTSDES